LICDAVLSAIDIVELRYAKGTPLGFYPADFAPL